MPSNVVNLPSATPEPTGSPCVQVDIVVMAEDVGFVDAVRESLEGRAPVWRARSPEESVDLLLAGRCGVLLIDMDALTSQPASLIEPIVDQFPDVVVVVAARREQEAALASLVGEGLIYRLIHKPFTVKRAGMFLQAAMRAHLQRRDDPTARPELPLTGKLRTRVAPRLRMAIGVSIAAVACVAVAGLVLTQRDRAPRPAQRAAQSSADPVLSQARAAFAAGRYDAPAGRNALDLYATVLRERPDNVEAQRGLETTAAQLVERAEEALAAGNAPEAHRLAARVLDVEPRHAGARALLARSDKDSRRSTTAAGVQSRAANDGTASSASRTASNVTSPITGERRAATSTQVASAPPVTGARHAMASTPIASAPATAARTAARPPAARATTSRVYVDPVAAVVVNEDELPSSPARSKVPRSGRSYGAPISSGHPTAGYVRRASAAATASASASASGSASASASASASTPAAGSSYEAASASTPASSAPDPLVQAPARQPLLPDSDLVRVAAVDPAYPPEAFRSRVAGWAEVEFTVDETGTPRDIAVTGAEPAGVFDAAAADAVAGWRYRPRVVNGRPVPQRTSVTLRFDVAD